MDNRTNRNPVEGGVLVGQGTDMSFDSNTLMFFSIGEFFASKLIMVFANANKVTEAGGRCNITFEFGNGAITGKIRYGKPKSEIDRVIVFTDIYELMDAMTTVVGEII